MIPVRIAGTGSVLPGRAVSTAEVASRTVPPRDPADVLARTGIAQRYWKNPEDTTASLGALAVTRALEAAGMPAEALERLILVTSNGGDALSPPTSSVLAARLGLGRRAACFDLNNACMGFLSALDVAARAVATGSGPVAIATVEIVSDAIRPDEHRAFLVMADAATAVIVAPAESDEGILGIELANDGTLAGSLLHAHPRNTGTWEPLRFGLPNREINALVVSLMAASAARVLSQAGCTVAEMDWVLAHQPNGPLYQEIAAAVGARPDQLVPVVSEVGSVGAASIPLSLDVLYRTRPVRQGQRVLLVGVGAGVSYGAAVVRL